MKAISIALMPVKKEIEIPDEYIHIIGADEDGNTDYELTDEGYDKYMGENSCLLNKVRGCVFRIETLDHDVIAEY